MIKLLRKLAESIMDKKTTTKTSENANLSVHPFAIISNKPPKIIYIRINVISNITTKAHLPQLYT